MQNMKRDEDKSLKTENQNYIPFAFCYLQPHLLHNKFASCLLFCIISSLSKTCNIFNIFLGLKQLGLIRPLFLVRQFIIDFFSDVDMLHRKSTLFPLPRRLHLLLNIDEPLIEPDCYKRLIGRLMYVNLARLDISHVVHHLSQFITAPKKPHQEATIYVLRYLKATVKIGLCFPINCDFRVTIYCDSDWASRCFSRKYLTGFGIFFGSSLIFRKIKCNLQFPNPLLRQSIIA